MEKIVFYLSGPIDKQNGKVNEFFRELGLKLEALGATVLTPEIRPDDVSDPSAVYLRDMVQAALADVIVVDSRESCGLGVGAEVTATLCTGGVAYFISPPNSHYRRDEVKILGRVGRNWTHPFVYGMSGGAIVSEATIDAVISALKIRPTLANESPSFPDYLAGLVNEFVSNGLKGDVVMQAAIKNNSRLGRKLKSLDRLG